LGPLPRPKAFGALPVKNVLSSTLTFFWPPFSGVSGKGLPNNQVNLRQAFFLQKDFFFQKGTFSFPL